MAKYKRKLKLNKTLAIAIILVFILISISIGYCVWTDSQTIIGDIKARYVEPKIENIEFIDENGDGNYTTLVEDYDGAISESRLDFLSNDVKYTVDENTNKMEILIDYEISGAWTTWGRWVYISFDIKNDNTVPMTLGSSELLEETFEEYEPKLTVPETIGAGEKGTITYSVYMKAPAYLDWGKSRFKIKYKIGEVTRYAYVTVDLKNL